MRVRTKRGGDAAYFTASNRPPAHLLPASLVSLATERDNIAAQLHQARGKMLNEQEWASRFAKAEQADRAAIIDAARAGNAVDEPASNRAKVDAERTRARDEVAALEAALRAVDTDFGTARAAEWETHRAKYDKARQDARTAIDKATAQVEAALGQGTQTEALCEWLAGDVYDGSAYVSADDVHRDGTGERIGVAHLVSAIRGYLGVKA